jgi:hypothetical protein
MKEICFHARLLRLVKKRISQILADEYAPNMKGYELGRVPKILAQLDKALDETEAALPKQVKDTLAPDEMRRLSVNEVIRANALLTRAGCRPDNPERGCVCEERAHDLAALTKRISESLSEEGTKLYGLQGLANAVLELHKQLGLTPSTAEDGTDWGSFGVEDLYYLDAVVRKAKGHPLRPPTHGIKCNVCGYSTAGPGEMTECPVGCPRILDTPPPAAIIPVALAGVPDADWTLDENTPLDPPLKSDDLDRPPINIPTDIFTLPAQNIIGPDVILPTAKDVGDAWAHEPDGYDHDPLFDE